jgi:hypothetical protein
MKNLLRPTRFVACNNVSPCQKGLSALGLNHWPISVSNVILTALSTHYLKEFLDPWSQATKTRNHNVMNNMVTSTTYNSRQCGEHHDTINNLDDTPTSSLTSNFLALGSMALLRGFFPLVLGLAPLMFPSSHGPSSDALLIVWVNPLKLLICSLMCTTV